MIKFVLLFRNQPNALRSILTQKNKKGKIDIYNQWQIQDSTLFKFYHQIIYYYCQKSKLKLSKPNFLKVN